MLSPAWEASSTERGDRARRRSPGVQLMSPTDATPDLERNPIERLPEEFLARPRRCECPSLTEYTSRYPELAEEIRDLFPALLLVERLKPAGDDSSGAAAVRPRSPTAPIGEAIGQLGDFRLI